MISVPGFISFVPIRTGKERREQNWCWRERERESNTQEQLRVFGRFVSSLERYIDQGWMYLLSVFVYKSAKTQASDCDKIDRKTIY